MEVLAKPPRSLYDLARDFMDLCKMAWWYLAGVTLLVVVLTDVWFIVDTNFIVILREAPSNIRFPLLPRLLECLHSEVCAYVVYVISGLWCLAILATMRNGRPAAAQSEIAVCLKL